MRLSIYQAPATLADCEGAFTRAAAMARSAAAAGAQMLLLPELFFPGYNRPDDHPRMAQPASGEWVGRMAQIAATTGCGLTFGWAEREGDALYNSAAAIDSTGRLLSTYRKIQLYGPMENATFKAGSSYATFDLLGRKAAMLVCYDIEFPVHAQNLARQGVELILVPTANPQGFEHVSDILIQARAVENEMTIAYANYAGADGDLRFYGGSVIAGPDGRLLARAGATEAMLVVDVPPKSLLGLAPVAEE